MPTTTRLSTCNNSANVRQSQAYKPHKKTAIWLDRAIGHINSVPYIPSSRWTFYRLLQDSTFHSKKEYDSKFIPRTSDARMRFYGDWRPWSMKDDSRNIISRRFSDADPTAFFSTIATIPCKLDPWPYQDYYVLVAFEARAMSDQFRYYTSDLIELCPVAGDAGPDFKWRIAELINDAREKYGKPIVLLYFGDCDKKGNTIYDTLTRDLKAWAAPFEAIWCGLNPEQANQFNLPENFEKPGQFQWEALSDEQAQSIILPALNQYIKPYPPELEALEQETNELLKRKMNEAQEEVYNDH